jgi:hypothetical protein
VHRLDGMRIPTLRAGSLAAGGAAGAVSAVDWMNAVQLVGSMPPLHRRPRAWQCAGRLGATAPDAQRRKPRRLNGGSAERVASGRIVGHAGTGDISRAERHAPTPQLTSPSPPPPRALSSSLPAPRRRALSAPCPTPVQRGGHRHDLPLARPRWRRPLRQVGRAEPLRHQELQVGSKHSSNQSSNQRLIGELLTLLSSG